MSCDPYKKRLSAYLDDEVPLPERRAIEDHLMGCAGCRTLREELARATQVLASSPEPHWNPNSTDALIGNLRAKLARERPVSRSLSVPPPPAAHPWRALAIPLAAVFLIVAVPGLWVGTRRPEPVAETRASAQVAAAPKAEAVRAKAPAPAVAAPAETQVAQVGSERKDARANVAPVAPAAAKPVLAAATSPAKDAGALGRMAETRALASMSAPAAPHASRLTPHASILPGLDIEIAELERRLQAVEREISSFTTAARQQAQRESNQVASRRFATWR